MIAPDNIDHTLIFAYRPESLYTNDLTEHFAAATITDKMKDKYKRDRLAEKRKFSARNIIL